MNAEIIERIKFHISYYDQEEGVVSRCHSLVGGLVMAVYVRSGKPLEGFGSNEEEEDLLEIVDLMVADGVDVKEFAHKEVFEILGEHVPEFRNHTEVVKECIEQGLPLDGVEIRDGMLIVRVA